MDFVEDFMGSLSVSLKRQERFRVTQVSRSLFPSIGAILGTEPPSLFTRNLAEECSNPGLGPLPRQVPAELIGGRVPFLEPNEAGYLHQIWPCVKIPCIPIPTKID